MASMRFSPVIIRVPVPSILASRDLASVSSRPRRRSFLSRAVQSRTCCVIYITFIRSRDRITSQLISSGLLQGLFLLERDAVDVFAKHGGIGSHYREELDCLEYRGGYHRKFPREVSNAKVLNELRLSRYIFHQECISARSYEPRRATRRCGETITQAKGRS